MPVSKTATAVLALLLLLAACTPTRVELLASFTSGDVEYELVTQTNHQGPDAPCVGVSNDLDTGAGIISMACPTVEAEETQYAASLEAQGSVFVVGYGLEPGEQIEFDDAVRVITTGQVDGRRFFLIQLTESPGTEPFEISVRAPDGTTRSIVSHGVED